MKRILFESVDDYPRIDAMICDMFHIPRNAKLLTNRVDANLGDDPDRAAMKRKLLNDEAAEFVKSDSPTDLQVFPPDQINPNHPPAVVGAGTFFRALATQVLTFDEDGLGVGNSDAAVKQLMKKEPVGGIDPELCMLAASDGSSLWQVGPGMRNYVALVSRMFLPGLIRIAFADLGLMSFLCRMSEEARRLMTALHEKFPAVPAVSDLPGCNRSKLEHFTKKVVPALAIQAVIAQGDPVGICDGGTLKQNEAYLGDDVVRALRDWCDTLEAPVDSDLKTADGRELDYDGLLELLDVDDMQRADVVNRATKNANGEYYEYVPPEEKDESESETDEAQFGNAMLKLHGSADGAALECPSYKINDWYVVYVPDYDHSSKGWFRFDEPSAEAQGHKFWMNGRTRAEGHYDCHRAVGESWCIVFNGTDFWRDWGPGHEHTAYYLVHESALDENVLSHSRADTEYRTTSVGCILAGYTDGEKSYVRGMVKNQNGMMDRANTYASTTSSAFFDKYMPSDMKRLTTNHASTEFDLAYRRNLLMLATIGVWTMKSDDWEEIKKEVSRLSEQYFPVQKNGEMAGDVRQTKRLVRAGDVYDVAAVMQDALDDESETFDTLMGGNTVFDVGTAGKYILQTLQATGEYTLFILSPLDGDGDVYPIIRNMDDDVVPLSDTPVPEDKANVMASKYHAHLIGEDIDDEPDYDEWDEGAEGGISYFRPFNGKMSANRVGIDGNNSMYVCGPDTDGQPVKVADNAPRPGLGRMCTYLPVEGGYNIVWRSYRADEPIYAIGYARNGRLRLYRAECLVDGTTAVLTDITSPGKGDEGDGHYTLGKISGDTLRLNADRYQSFIAIDSVGWVTENLGLSREAIESFVREKGRSVIGLGIPNGRFDGNIAGTITWYDADTMAERGQMQIRVDALDRSRQDGNVRRFGL